MIVHPITALRLYSHLVYRCLTSSSNAREEGMISTSSFPGRSPYTDCSVVLGYLWCAGKWMFIPTLSFPDPHLLQRMREAMSPRINLLPSNYLSQRLLFLVMMEHYCLESLHKIKNWKGNYRSLRATSWKLKISYQNIKGNFLSVCFVFVFYSWDLLHFLLYCKFYTQSSPIGHH